jgi:hypothetical protein
MDKSVTILAVVAAVLLGGASAGAQAADPYTAALAGAWHGTLEYRDYRSDGRVTLPTLLTATPAADGVTLAYTYDDGPGKTVRSTERITIAADRSSYRIRNGDGTYDATFAATGLREFGAGSNTVVLMGKGTENDQPVDLRITITLTAGTFSMRRESRLAGGDWRFRNEYQFKKQPPAGRR